MWWNNIKPIAFERIVTDLLSAEVGKALRAGHSAIHHNVMMIGKSGHTHQIDIVAEMLVAGVQIIILVECKYYSRRVATNDVLEFAARIDDVSAHKGIIVTSRGFQRGAALLAKAKGIALVRVVPYSYKGYERRPPGYEWVLVRAEARMVKPDVNLLEPNNSERFLRWLSEYDCIERWPRESDFWHTKELFDKLDWITSLGCYEEWHRSRCVVNEFGQPEFAYLIIGPGVSMLAHRDSLLAVLALGGTSGGSTPCYYNRIT
jgi:hypothetical protein